MTEESMIGFCLLAADASGIGATKQKNLVSFMKMLLPGGSLSTSEAEAARRYARFLEVIRK